MPISEKEARGREFLRNIEAEIKDHLLHYFAAKGILAEAQREGVASTTAKALSDYLCFT